MTYFEWLEDLGRWDELDVAEPVAVVDFSKGRAVGMFDIPGKPMAMPRNRINFNTKANYMSPSAKKYKDKIRGIAKAELESELKKGNLPIKDPKSMELCIKTQFKTPKFRYRGHHDDLYIEERSKKPDFDNLGKMIADALNEILYDDDKQVSIGMVHKVEAAPSKPELTRVAFKYNL